MRTIMHASQSSGDAGRKGRAGAMPVALPPVASGPMRGTWRLVTGVAEDLIILGQFAFGRDYRAGDAAKPRLAFTSQLVSRGSA